MEDTFDPLGSGPAAPWGYRQNTDRLALPTILIVDDDPDIRDMLATLLDLSGFACVTCDTAEAALAALRDQPVDLVLTDYALPIRTGVWLLERAEEEGLLEGTPVMIVTAHPNPAGATAYEIVQKPFDLDDLVSRVKQRMESSGPRRRGAGGSRANQDNGRGTGDGDCPLPVELILYVSSRSVRSAAAVKNIEKALTRFRSSRVRLTVCDLSVNPAKAEEDSVAFTPTLVRRSPGPRTYILGHITNPELVMELLADCELEEQ